VTGNNLIWRTVTFAGVMTNKVRIQINATGDNYSQLPEIEVYALNPAPAAGAVNWLVSDHLGTPRMIVDQTGTLANVKRHDYLPFGEELFGGTNTNPGPGGRTPSLGYGCDPSNPNCAPDRVRQQFTQKERDVETGMDYFLARYYSSTQGRFTSPDEFVGGPDELLCKRC
jgi:RHS repeat-associated protein